jgi:hypothetical protein
LKLGLACIGALLFALCLLSDRVGFLRENGGTLKRLLVGVSIAASLP